MHSPRRRGKGRSRILYWFRTPPGVRVGRSALDEEAIRLIEEHNPRIQFDWTQILKGQGDPGDQDFPAASERSESKGPASSERREPRGRAHGDRRQSRGPALSERSESNGRTPQPAVERRAWPPPPAVPPAIAPPEEDRPPNPHTDRADTPKAFDEVEVDELPVVGESADLDETVIDAGSAEERPPTAAHARLGSEGVLRLRGRYADILAGIHDRVQDEARREELKAQAERLNPDNWVTEEEVRLGLEQYETVFESLRSVAGRRRRRRRGRPGNPL